MIICTLDKILGPTQNDSRIKFIRHKLGERGLDFFGQTGITWALSKCHHLNAHIAEIAKSLHVLKTRSILKKPTQLLVGSIHQSIPFNVLTPSLVHPYHTNVHCKAIRVPLSCLYVLDQAHTLDHEFEPAEFLHLFLPVQA